MLYLSFIVLVFVSILGIITLLNIIYEAFLDKITERKIVLNSENCGKTEYLVRTSLAKNEGDIEVVNSGMSQDALEILMRLQSESGRIILSSVKEE